MKLLKRVEERYLYGENMQTCVSYEPTTLQDIRAAAKEMGFAVIPLKAKQEVKDAAVEAFMHEDCINLDDLIDELYKAMLSAAQETDQ